jgi:hypothetical protein
MNQMKRQREMLQSVLDEQAEFLVVGAYAMAAGGVPRATGCSMLRRWNP